MQFCRSVVVIPFVFLIIAFSSACGDSGNSSSFLRDNNAPQQQDESRAFGNAATIPPTVPVGFAVTPAGVSLTATSLSFSPDGNTLYVATFPGFVFAMPVAGGLIAGPPLPFLTGLSMPLGVLATDDAVFVSVVQDGAGAVLRSRDTNGDFMADVTETVLSGLPIGRHNTNGLSMGPDGMLYVVQGNSSDSGFRDEGGSPDIPPFSGSLLRLDPAGTDLLPDASMVVATGWRNPFDVTFVPDGHPSLPSGMAAVTMNGPDGESYTQPDGSSIQRPVGEDTLSLFSITDGTVEHFGFPWCLYDRNNNGLAGFAQDLEEGNCHPLTSEAFAALPGSAEQAFPAALFGAHVSSNGLAFNPGGNFPAEYDGDLFVTEFGSNPGGDTAGHKVVRVRFDDSGNVMAVEDFLSSPAPLDLTFGPDGALWIADFSGLLLRVSALGP